MKAKNYVNLIWSLTLASTLTWCIYNTQYVDISNTAKNKVSNTLGNNDDIKEVKNNSNPWYDTSWNLNDDKSVKPKPKITTKELSVFWDDIIDNNTYSNKSQESDEVFIERTDEYERWLINIWKIEMKYFKKFFGSVSENDVYYKILEIQKNNWIREDWIIWPQTLEIVYKNYYSSSIKWLPKIIQKRWEIYLKMQKYSEKTRKLEDGTIIKASHIPNVFDKKLYYWKVELNDIEDTFSENIEDTFIDETLLDVVKGSIEENWNKAYLYKHNWNYIAAVYFDWDLKLASYASPWNVNKYWKDAETKLWNFKAWETVYKNTHHISWADESVKEWKWAIMPFAIQITGWIYVHAWVVSWWKESHWCIRIPMHYAEWLYAMINKYWNIDWNVINN